MTTCMGKNYSFGVRAFREHSSIRECVLLFLLVLRVGCGG